MSEALENLLSEDRKFPPPPEFTAQANAKPGVHEAANADYLAFWQEQALSRITWDTAPTIVLDDSNPPFFKWFSDGELNISANCLDRHLADHGDQVAYHWVGEPGDERTLTYSDLHAEVCRFANGLKSLGMTRGTGSPSTWGWSPSFRSPCSPAPGSGWFTRWCSAAFRPRRSPVGSTMPRPDW